MQTKYKPRIEEVPGTPEAKLWISHNNNNNNNNEIGFAALSFGPDTYENVGREILARGLQLPNGEHITSLLHSAYCDTESIRNTRFDIIHRLISFQGGLWAYVQNLFTFKGVYAILDSQANGKNERFDVSELEDKLKGGKELSWGGIRFSEDGRYRFAPKESCKEIHTPESLSRDGLIIINCGIQGAEKLAEVSNKMGFGAIIHLVEINDKYQTRLEIFNLCYSPFFSRLRIPFPGRDWGDVTKGSSFGLVK